MGNEESSYYLNITSSSLWHPIRKENKPTQKKKTKPLKKGSFGTTFALVAVFSKIEKITITSQQGKPS